MKTNRLIFLTGAMACGLAVTLFTGCASPKAAQQARQQKEALMVEAGFKAVPAVTPEQKRMLSMMPSDRICAITRAGKVYIIYPDPSRNMLYVGSNNELLAYESKAQALGLEPGDWEANWGDW